MLWHLLPIEIRKDYLFLSFEKNNENQVSAHVHFAKFT